MGLGALNDNLFKSALAILIAYSYPKGESDLYIQLSAGLFILPFFLFSGISGQICDRYEKSFLMNKIKTLEILVMTLGFFAFYFDNLYLQLTAIFLMGSQSTLFGPVKYSYLPLSQSGANLLAANSLTSMGTFIFILIGTVMGGLFVSKNFINQFGLNFIATSVFILALMGRYFSGQIPTLDNPEKIKINLNPFTETFRTLKLSFSNKHIFRSVHGISWFWFFGFFFMASLPSFIRDILKGDELTASIFLTVISIGMGIGSILCNKISEGELKMGVVPIASFGITISGIIFSLTPTIELVDPTIKLTISTLFKGGNLYIPIISLFFVGAFGGAFIVPLYTQLQINSPENKRSQFIACNNIMNAIYMVSAAILAMVMLQLGLQIKDMFLIVSLINIVIGIWFLCRYPSDFYLVFFKLTFKLIYKITIKLEAPLPKSGPTIVVCNHISFIDPLLVTAAMNRPPIFIMDQFYFNIKALQWFFNTARAIPIVTKKICPDGLEKAMKMVQERLNQSELIAFFPEAYISKDGEIINFKPGIEKLAKDNPGALIIPMAISGMWGSWFSRYKNGKALNGIPKRRNLRTEISINIGKPLTPEGLTKEKLTRIVKDLRGNIK